LEASSAAEERDAEALATKARMMKTLKQLSVIRNKLVSDSATEREVTAIVDVSNKAVVDSTDRMIRLSIEVS